MQEGLVPVVCSSFSTWRAAAAPWYSPAGLATRAGQEAAGGKQALLERAGIHTHAHTEKGTQVIFSLMNKELSPSWFPQGFKGENPKFTSSILENIVAAAMPTPTHGRMTLQDLASLCRAPRVSLCGSNSTVWWKQLQSFGVMEDLFGKHFSPSSHASPCAHLAVLRAALLFPGQHWAAPGWPSPLAPFPTLIMTNGKKQVSRWRVLLWRTFHSWPLFYVYSAFKMCF